VAELRGSEVLKQINAAWQQAQDQLKELRTQVEKTAAMAQAKVQSNFLERDLDRAYRDLGEAVWAQVSRGQLTLPKNMAAVLKALEAVTQRIQEQNASINDLLSEGADMAAKLKEKMSKTAVATKDKKR
jgi:hypothetical protein